MSGFASVVARLPLVWVRVYTLGLAAPLRTARCHEISSDTYEHVHDPSLAYSPGVLAWDLVRSLFAGIPDDLRWRATYVSVWGTIGQSLVVSSPLAALAAFIFYHSTQQIGVALLAALVVETAVAGALAGLSYLEVNVNTEDGLPGGEHLGIERKLAAAALVAFPALLLTAQLIIPFASGADPVGDKADLVSRADATNRWSIGYGVLALAVLAGMYAMISLGTVLRHRGVIALGTIAPLLFSIGGVAVIVGGPGVMGVGLAHVLDSGLDGRAYLEGSGEAGLVAWWFGSLTCAVSLLLIAVATWRAELLSGWLRIVCIAGLALEALAIGLLPGFGGSGIATLPAPIVGFIAFGSLALGLVSSEDGARVPRPAFGTTFAKS